jgi:hypothetical protein
MLLLFYLFFRWSRGQLNILFQASQRSGHNYDMYLAGAFFASPGSWAPWILGSVTDGGSEAFARDLVTLGSLDHGRSQPIDCMETEANKFFHGTSRQLHLYHTLAVAHWRTHRSVPKIGHIPVLLCILPLPSSHEWIPSGLHGPEAAVYCWGSAVGRRGARRQSCISRGSIVCAREQHEFREFRYRIQFHHRPPFCIGCCRTRSVLCDGGWRMEAMDTKNVETHDAMSATPCL